MKRLVIAVLVGVITAGLLAPSARAEEKPAFFACVSPWNFPLAIFLGQTAAALVAWGGR
jgi:delta 1-pyrroline-5-carboxylate dehydrogenase